MLTIFGAVAELERAYILQRQREGMRSEGTSKYRGRQPIQSPTLLDTIAQWERGELTAVAAQKRLGISRSTFYRNVRSIRSAHEK